MAKKKKGSTTATAMACEKSETPVPLEESCLELANSSEIAPEQTALEQPASEPAPKQPESESETQPNDSYMDLTSDPQPEAQPKTSPYASPPVAIFIGPNHKKHYILQDLLQNPDWIASSSALEDGIKLLDVDESTGHVLLHYLYTGAYETLDSTETLPANGTRAEFKRAILVYIAAKTYNLDGLQELARRKTEQFGTDMSIFDIVDVVQEDFARIPGDAVWFCDYLEKKMEAAFEEDHTVFAGDDFFGGIEDFALTRVLARGLMRLYSDKVSRLLAVERQAILGIAKESAYDFRDSSIQDAPVEELCVAEESCPVEELPVMEEPCPVEDPYVIEEPCQQETAKEIEVLDAEPEIREDDLTVATTANELNRVDAPTETGAVDDCGSLAIREHSWKQPKSEPPPSDPLPEVSATTINGIVLEIPSNPSKIDISFDGNVGGQTSPGLFSGGFSMWASGWGAKNPGSWGVDDASKDQSADNDKFCGSVNEKEKGGNGFDFNFDKFGLAETTGPATLEEGKPEGDGGDLGAVSGKKKKKEKKKDSLPPGTEKKKKKKESLTMAKKKQKKVKKAEYIEEPSLPSLDMGSEPVVEQPKEEFKVEELPPTTIEPELEKTKGFDFEFSSTKKEDERWGKHAEYDPAPQLEPEPKPVVEHAATVQVICPFRANHLMGDKWEHCKQCRAMLHLIATQLARLEHSDEGYETLDQMLAR